MSFIHNHIIFFCYLCFNKGLSFCLLLKLTALLIWRLWNMHVTFDLSWSLLNMHRPLISMNFMEFMEDILASMKEQIQWTGWTSFFPTLKRLFMTTWVSPLQKPYPVNRDIQEKRRNLSPVVSHTYSFPSESLAMRDYMHSSKWG